MTDKEEGNDKLEEAAADRDAILARHVAQLAEHFDSVRIVTTWNHGDSTALSSAGSGNWYAQFGSVRSWVDNADNSEDD